MMNVQSPNRNDSATTMREIQASLARLERRDWWRWGTALAIMLLLTLGLFSLSLAGIRKETFDLLQLDVAVRGLLALVLVFDVFVIYQQMMISRLRRQLSSQIGMMAALEVLKPASEEEQATRKERRRTERCPFDRRLEVKTIVDGKWTVCFGRVIDLSELGLGAVVSGSLARGDKVSLEFNAGPGDLKLTLPATVRYVHGFRHGFEFAGVRAEQVDVLRRACRPGPSKTA
ncbi:MAG: PilZ domain-containing protein [Acidobacteriia bacterium]|nr:PilZ domain-containing protein [Terriglobia bacterium]